MVRKQALLFFAMLLVLTSEAFALLDQTRMDLVVAEDRLKFQANELRDRGQVITPILLATPKAFWEESKADFSPAMVDMLRRVFPNTGDLIPCAECFESRVFVSNDNRTVIQNGELSLSDLALLRERPGFSQARSILTSKETPSGIAVRLVSLNDGMILYTGLLDATKNLSDVEPPLRLAREMERRARGESLTYFHMDLGLYPQGLFQMSWLEQWGSRNQHLSGLAIGLFNPTGALGATYHYMLPGRRRTTVGMTAYYSLESLFSSNSVSLSKAVIGQASLNYGISGAYGIFISFDTAGAISAGFSFRNPVFLPFLL